MEISLSSACANLLAPCNQWQVQKSYDERPDGDYDEKILQALCLLPWDESEVNRDACAISYESDRDEGFAGDLR